MSSPPGSSREHRAPTAGSALDLDRPLDTALVAALVELIPDAAIVVDDGGRIRHANHLAAELFGYAPGELAGSDLDQLIPETLRESHRGHLGRYVRAQEVRPMGSGLDLRGRRQDGREFPVDVSLAPLATDGGTIFVAAIRDLTERRREQAAQAHLAAIVESTNDAIAATTPDGIVTSWNAGAERLLGYTADEMMGQPIFVVVADEFRAPLVAARQRVLGGERVSAFESRRRRKDGTLVDVEVTLSAITDRGGEVRGVSGVFRDITERRRAEAELARVQRDLAELALLGDRERIARDLHHRVIQRVFACGMTLQSVAALAVRPEVAERIRHIIDELDAVTTEIRSTIFALEQRQQEVGRLRRRVLSLAHDAGADLGHDPIVRFSGPVDTAVPPEVGKHVEAVVREALANVARHAHASATTVDLAVDGELVVTVADNGIGMTDTTGSGGLDELRSRATELGGWMTVVSNSRGGTTLEWRVSLAGTAGKGRP